MPALWRDDNAQSINDPSALKGTYATTGIKVATTGAAVVEVDISGLTYVKSEVGQDVMIRLANGSANDCLYAFSSAADASITGNTNMALLPKGWVEMVSITPSLHKSFYHLQVTGATTLQLMVLK